MGSPLLAVLRAAPDLDAVRATVERVDPVRLVREGIRHGVVGYLDELVRGSGVALPDPIRDELAVQARGTAAAVLRTKRTLLVALDALAELELRPVVLKGYALGMRLYPSPLLRTSRDVDLLVARDRLDDAVARLERAGFERVPSHRREPHHLELRLGTELLELHFDALEGFGERLPAAPLLARAVPFELEGRPAAVLAPDDEPLYLALHAVNHLLQRASWLLDLKLLWLSRPPDADRFVAAAARAPLGRYAFYALEAVHRLLDAPVGPELLDRLRPSAAAPLLARTLFTERTVGDGWLATHKWAWHGAKVALLGDPVALWRWVRVRAG